MRLNISYAVQSCQGGLAQAFILGNKFVGNDSNSLILGDNTFYGHELKTKLKNVVNQTLLKNGYGQYLIKEQIFSDKDQNGVTFNQAEYFS